jgi:hypothetical protein
MRFQTQNSPSLARVYEFEAELADVRGLAMMLGKASELQGAAALPVRGDPVWGTLGALGGTQHTLDVVLGHLKAQEARARAAEAKAEQVEARLRSEGTQRAAITQARGAAGARPGHSSALRQAPCLL